MNIDRLVERQLRLEMVGQRQRMALGVGKRKFASGIACTSDQPAAHGACISAEANRLDLGDRGSNLGLGNVRTEQVLPYGEPQSAGAVAGCDRARAAQLRCAQATGREHTGDVTEPGWSLRMHDDM